MKKYLGLLVIIFLLTGCKEKIYTKIPEEVSIEFSNDPIEVYSNISLNDLVINSNVEIINQDLDTNFVQEKEINYYFTYNEKKYVSKLTYNVVDTTPPKIFGSGTKTVLVNYKGDLCNLVTYGDNYDSEPNCYITGDYDLEKVGTYKITINVDDFNNNSKEFHLTLNVVNNIDNTKNTTSTKKINFSDAYKTYKKDDNELGIDVSKWQGDIDFAKVKEANASFVMIRLGVKLNSNEEPNIDSYYLENIKNAKEAGLKVGVYLYSKALSKEEAKEEAEWVLNILNNEELDLPVVFDWEIWSGWNTYHLSFHDLNEIAKSFISEIESHGYKGMLYGSKFYLENFWDNTYENVWLAHYVDKTSYEDYQIWQFSNTGRISGINGDVDLDIMKK